MKLLRRGLYVGGAVLFVGGVVWFARSGWVADQCAIGGVIGGVALVIGGAVVRGVEAARNRLP